MKSKDQQSTHVERQGKESFKIEANFNLSICMIKVCKIYVLYTLKIDIHS